MKRLTLAVVCLLVLSGFAFSQQLGPWKATYGEWRMEDGRLVQTSTWPGMAQAHMRLPQSGIMQFEFDVRYVDGAQDNYAGFGVHVGIDQPNVGKGWGNGRSYLLWLTYYPKAYGGTGVCAQAYKSDSKTVMNLMHRGNAYTIPADRLGIDVNRLSSYTLPVKIRINFDTGSLKVYDPVIPDYFYRFTLGAPIRGGAYVAVRTNSLAASFGNFKVTKLDRF